MNTYKTDNIINRCAFNFIRYLDFMHSRSSLTDDYERQLQLLLENNVYMKCDTEYIQTLTNIKTIKNLNRSICVSRLAIQKTIFQFI